MTDLQTMETTKRLDTIEEYNQMLGAETLHPLVAVTDLSKLGDIRHCKIEFGFYCIYYKALYCGTIEYGRNKYDYQDGTLLFIAPGQSAGVNDGGVSHSPQAIALMFHPDLLYGTSLARRMKDYTFFSYDSNEALHMSEREKAIILGCFRSVATELEHGIDKHTKQIVASNIETMLNHCVRFYERQFITREIPNKSILNRFDKILHDWFESGKAKEAGLPSVQMCANQLCLSPNYFGDLVKKELGKTAQEYIQLSITDKAKELLAENEMNISEVAYELGFKYPHHMTRMFKKITGITPNEYRLHA